MFRLFFRDNDAVVLCSQLRDVLVKDIRWPNDTVSTVVSYMTTALENLSNRTSAMPAQPTDTYHTTALLARTQALDAAVKSATQHRIQPDPPAQTGSGSVQQPYQAPTVPNSMQDMSHPLQTWAPGSINGAHLASDATWPFTYTAYDQIFVDENWIWSDVMVNASLPRGLGGGSTGQDAFEQWAQHMQPPD